MKDKEYKHQFKEPPYLSTGTPSCKEFIDKCNTPIDFNPVVICECGANRKRLTMCLVNGDTGDCLTPLLQHKD